MTPTLDPMATLIEQLAGRVADKVLEKIESRLSDVDFAFTEEEAAEKLRIEHRQLADERREGKISHSKVRMGRIRYTPKQIRDYLDGREVGSK